MQFVFVNDQIFYTIILRRQNSFRFFYYWRQKIFRLFFFDFFSHVKNRSNSFREKFLRHCRFLRCHRSLRYCRFLCRCFVFRNRFCFFFAVEIVRVVFFHKIKIDDVVVFFLKSKSITLSFSSFQFLMTKEQLKADFTSSSWRFDEKIE